jgi:hypothetical protein
MVNRRFPPPWSAEEQPACFVVRDNSVTRAQQPAMTREAEEDWRR